MFLLLSDVDKRKMQFLANNVAAFSKIGDIIKLKGDLGAGKTTFAQYFISYFLGKDIRVTSPTFNLVSIYETKNFPIWHFDLYRLEKNLDLFELGIEDAFNAGVSLIEWPEIMGDFIDKNTIQITIDFAKDGKKRIVTVDCSEDWQERVRDMKLNEGD
jgi:tRNA threonylcarbamoyladenosine biosynthesis protein TsaE